jgi:hypothetical protein
MISDDYITYAYERHKKCLKILLRKPEDKRPLGEISILTYITTEMHLKYVCNFMNIFLPFKLNQQQRTVRYIQANTMKE